MIIKALLSLLFCIGNLCIKVDIQFPKESIPIRVQEPCSTSSKVYERTLEGQKRIYEHTGSYANPSQEMIITIRDDSVSVSNEEALGIISKIKGIEAIQYNSNSISIAISKGARYHLYNNSDVIKEAIIYEIYNRIYYHSYYYLGNGVCVKGPEQHTDVSLGMVVELEE